MNTTPDPFKTAKFDIEHAINMYATSYSTFPIQGIYHDGFIDSIRQASDSFHIYLIGFTPKMVIDTPKFSDGKLRLNVTYMNRNVELSFDIPNDFRFVQEVERYHFVDGQGKHRWPSSLAIIRKLSIAVDGCPLLIKYIGQAYGKDGTRDAIDRLLKHETVQKISIMGAPEGYTM